MTTQSDRPPTWQMVSVRQRDGSLAAAVEVGGEYAVPEVLQGHLSLIDVMRAWPAVANALRSVDLHGARRIDVAEVLAPLTYPSKVLCSGPNFRDHLAEMGESGLGESWVPYFFFKPPTTTVVAAGAAVLVSGDPAERPDYEAELAVVIGVGGRDIGVSAAMDHVAGYLVANDISMRGPFKRETPAAPFVWDWAAQKCADTSLPMGRGIVPAWLVDDVQDLKIRTEVNGVMKQDGWTGDMVYGVAALVAAASQIATLEPGDVILTGTPAGVGAGRGEFLAPGDTVRVSIEGIGSLQNPIHRR